jgi:hypothetical protein
VQVELLHAIYRVQTQSPWFRKSRPLEPLVWPRPNKPAKKRMLSPGEFVRAVAIVGGN